MVVDNDAAVGSLDLNRAEDRSPAGQDRLKKQRIVGLVSAEGPSRSASLSR